MKDKTLTVGIIGAGDIVSKVHLPILKSIPEIEVSWIFDKDQNKAKTLANAYKIKNLHTKKDINELPHEDIYLLGIPFGARDKYYELISNYPSGIYTEKPFSNSLNHHKKICSLFDSYKLCSGLQRRSSAQISFIKELIESKFFGKLNKISFGLSNTTALGDNRYQNSKEIGGGILFDLAIHGIDAIFYSTNSINYELKECSVSMYDGFDVHTSANFIVKNINNEAIECKILVSRLQRTENIIEFMFDNVSLFFNIYNYDDPVKIKNKNCSVEPLKINLANQFTNYPVTCYQVFYVHWKNFLNGFFNKTTNYTNASESLLTTSFLEDLYSRGKVNE